MLDIKALFPHLLLALILGVGLASAFTLPTSFLFFLIFLAVVFLLVGLCYRRSIFFTATLMTVFLLLGMVRFIYWQETPRSALMDGHVSSPVTLVGMVVDEPDIRETSTHLTLLVRTVEGTSIADGVSTRVLVFAPRYPEYQYGDVLRVKGELAVPKKFSEGDGRVFDYPMYLTSKGVQYQIFFPQIEFSTHENGNALIGALYRMKHGFQEKLAMLFPEPHSALLGGLLLGGKQSLGSAWQETFRVAGIVHIVVLSGYNMTIVSEWLVSTFRFLGFYGSLSMGGVGIVLFALMTGAGATVLRAAIMAIIALLARATGRTHTMGRALLLAGACMVLQNPSILAFDPSFQLSFLASLGLIFVSPVVERHTQIFRRYKVVREVFVSTVATQCMVLPLLLYQTGLFSLFSLPANMLVLPAIPLTMLTGFIAGLGAYIVPPLAHMLALPAYALLSWILFVAEGVAHIPFAAVSIPLSFASVGICYVVFALFLWREHRTMHHEVERPAPSVP